MSDDLDRAADDGYPFDDEDPEEDDWEFDCGLDREGYCHKAGSEQCDFECPYRDRR